MFKRWLLTDMLIFVITLSFAAQICVFTATVSHNPIGIVYGANGPIAGVYVSATDATGTGSGSGFAITDSSGHYSMTTGLVTGMYNLTTFVNGYIPGKRDLVNVTIGQTTLGIDIDLAASGGISGTVTDVVNGNPINGTNLYASLSNGTFLSFGWFATTGSDGKYFMATNLATGMYNVSIFLAPDGYIRGMTTANVVAGVETKNVNLQLARSGILSGKVAAPNGTGLFGISVTAISTDFTQFGSTSTDMSGNYRIATGLGNGSYYVSATGAGNSTRYGSGFLGTPVSVTPGLETIGINIELTPVTTPPTPSGTITGRITDQTSNPIRGADITATGSNGTSFGTSDSNGYYNVSSGLGTGNDYNVSVTASGYNDASYATLVSVTVGQTTPNINIQMTAKPAQNYGTITGTVTGAPNPLVPEFQYPLMVMLLLMLATVVVGKLTLKTRRPGNNRNPA